MIMELSWCSLPHLAPLHAVPGVTFSEMLHFMCKVEYPKSSSSWLLWSMHHFLASIFLIMFRSEFSCWQVWTDQSPLQNLSWWRNGRTVTHGQELCTCPRFHGDMEHLFSNKMPGFMGETVLQLTCLPFRAAAGNSMPVEQTSTFFSQGCQLPLQNMEYGICIKNTHKPLLSSKAANLPFPTCQARASVEKSCPISPPTPPWEVSHLPSYWSYLLEEWNPRSPVWMLSKSRVPKSSNTHEKHGERSSQPLKDMGRRLFTGKTKVSLPTC